MFNSQYETHADMLNDLARRILDLFAAIRKLYAAVGFAPKIEIGG